jgi:hypothetical protein
MVSDQGCENDADDQQLMEAGIPADRAGSGWRSGRAESQRLNRTAPKKSHTAIVNWPTDGGRPVCLSAAKWPLVRTLCIAHPAPSHFAITG